METRPTLLSISFTCLLGFVLLCSLFACLPRELFGQGWRQAEAARRWSFPRDHGSHPDYRTEWWYFTGNLADNEGRRYGYQLTFFRYGLALNAKNHSNPWSVRDVHLAHFAITNEYSMDGKRIRL